LENKNFVPVPFWQIRVQTERSGTPFAVVSREKYDSKDVANAVFGKLQGNSLTVQTVEKKEINQEPPLLYDLTSLQ
jgi:DNA topoisomerase-3